MNAIKTIRNNWKKSVAFVGVSAFGIYYANKKYKERLILKAYCREAQKYGEESIKEGNNRPRKVTVFLNPRARKGKGKELYDKYAAPLLHLAGLEVTLVQTEYEGQAKQYMEVVDSTDIIVAAGGDGTVSEVVTGMLRRSDEKQFSKTPLGVVPVGHTNTLAKSLCPRSDVDVIFLAEMAMSIIKGRTRPVDAIHIKGDEDKSVYAVSGMEWGSYTDAEMRKKRNWYFGPLKHRMAYVVTALRYWPPSNEAIMSYTLPCGGCSQCYVPPTRPQWRWWHLFMPPRVEVTKDMSGIVNEECGNIHTEKFTTPQFSVKSNVDASASANDEVRSMTVKVLDEATAKKSFIADGWNRLKGRPLTTGYNQVEVGEFTLQPSIPQNQEAWLLIDNERFELMNMTCRLLPNKLQFLFSDSLSVAIDSSTNRLLTVT